MAKNKIISISKPYIYCLIIISLITSFALTRNFVEKYISPDNSLTGQSIIFVDFIKFFLFGLAIYLFVFRNKLPDLNVPEPPFNPKYLLLPLLFIAILALLHTVTVGQQFHSLFDLDSEYNFPSWFSSVQLGIIAFLSLLILSKKEKKSLFWIIMSSIFTLVSIDEFVMLHERASGLWKLYDNFILGPAAVLVIAALLISGYNEFSQEKQYLFFIISGFLVMAIGAVGFDFIGHLLLNVKFGYPVFTIFEESFEMLGESVILLTVYSYYSQS